MSTRTRFEKEAKGNSEMAYSHSLIFWPLTTRRFRIKPLAQLGEVTGGFADAA